MFLYSDMQDVFDKEILDKYEIELENQMSFLKWYNNKYKNDFNDCLNSVKKNLHQIADQKQVCKAALKQCTKRNWNILKCFFSSFSYEKKQQILKTYQLVFSNNKLFDNCSGQREVFYNKMLLPFIDIENEDFINLMNGTILERVSHWFSNLCCCTNNNSDVDVN